VAVTAQGKAGCREGSLLFSHLTQHGRYVDGSFFFPAPPAAGRCAFAPICLVKLSTNGPVRFLHLIRPFMAILPEVAAPDRRVGFALF
jgi:hypothetical protein